MLYQIGIKDGFAQVKGSGTHFKIISAATPLRLQALDSNGRVLLDSKFRAPMATELPAPAAVINLYADDQTVELWYSNQPLEFLQLTAVGSGNLRTTTKEFLSGRELIIESNPRSKIMIKATEEIKIGGLGVNESGWPLAAGETITLETIGAIYGYKAPQVPVLSDFENLGVQTVTGQNIGNIAVFNGQVYAVTDELEPRLMKLESGAFTQIIGAPKMWVIVSYKKALWGIASNASGPALVKSIDGVNWSIINIAQIAGVQRSQSYSSICKGVLTTKRLSGIPSIMADLNTGEIKAIEGQVNDYTDYIVTDNGVYGFTSSTTVGILAKKNQDGWETIASGNVFAVGANALNGEIFFIGAGNNPYKLVNDELVKVGNLTNSSPCNFVSYGEVNAFISNTACLFTYQGQEYSIPSNTVANAANIAISDTLPEMYRVQGAFSGNLNLQTISTGAYVTPQPMQINVLEFLV